MATDHPLDRTTIATGIVAGVVAAAVMGAMLTTMLRPVIESAIPALYGLSGLAAGWAVHLFHGAVFGGLFAAVASRDPLDDYAASLGGAVGVGAGYGVVLWVVAAALVMPVWLGAVGFPAAPSLPNLDPQSLVGHLVFGVVLGGAYAVLR